jgi:DNA-binding NarL/FixJ family response regulator
MYQHVIICDQQKLYALGSYSILKEQSMFESYIMLNDLKDIDHYLSMHSNALLVLDSGLLNFAEPSILAHFQRLQKDHPIMVIMNEEDDAQLFRLIDAGVSVMVSRNVSEQEYMKALEMASKRKIFFCDQLAPRVYNLVYQVDKIKLSEAVHDLDSYDKYILIRVCEEASSKQIAQELFCSKRTVEGHRTRLMQQFGVTNVAGLVKIAMSTKLYQHYLSNPGLYDLTACAKTSSL